MCSYSAATSILGAMGSFQFGFSVALMNTIASQVAILQKVCPTENDAFCDERNYASMVSDLLFFLATAVGSMACGTILINGVRRAFQITMMVIATSYTVALIYVESKMVFIGARFVLGFGVGFVSVICPMYISESTTAKRRGFFVSLHQLQITIGILCAIAFGLLLTPIVKDSPLEPLKDGTLTIIRMLLATPIVISVSVLMMSLFYFTSETPTFLVGCGRTEEAAIALQQIYDKDDIQDELEGLITSTETASGQSEAMSVWQAFGKPTYRKVLIIALILSMGQQFSGINVIVAKSNQIFERAGLDNPTKASIVMAISNVLLTFPPMFLSDILGRRTLMLFGSFTQFVVMTPAAVIGIMYPESPYMQQLSLIAVIGYVFAFAMAWGPIMWIYINEIFPPEIKDSAVSLVAASNWASCIVTIGMANIPQLSNAYMFAIFAVISIGVFMYLIPNMLETKGYPIGESPYFTKESRSENQPLITGV